MSTARIPTTEVTGVYGALANGSAEGSSAACRSRSA